MTKREWEELLTTQCDGVASVRKKTKFTRERCERVADAWRDVVEMSYFDIDQSFSDSRSIAWRVEASYK